MGTEASVDATPCPSTASDAFERAGSRERDASRGRSELFEERGLVVSALVRGVSLGVALGAGRLARRTLVIGAGALAVTGLVVLVQRTTSQSGGVEQALHLSFSWIIPLLCLAVVTAGVGQRSLREMTWSAARFGVPRQAVAFGIALAISVACVVPAVLCALVSVIGAHTPNETIPLGRDMVTCGWIAALGAWAYAAWLSFGATFGSKGGGRGWVIALDFVLGSAGFAAYALPRGNTMNLLGFDDAAEISQRQSSLILPVVAIVMTLLASFRARD